MKRRDFLKQSLHLGAGAALTLSNPALSLASPGTPDLVGVMGGEPGPMFDRGIQALGGIQRFVRPNQTVVIKPNIGWDTPPERAADTNPDLIRQMVAQCRDAGAKKVYVFDHTADVWQKCYAHSGIKQAVKDAGGHLVPGNSDHHYHPIQVPRGKNLTRAYAHELFLESDVFINVPVLKNHIATKLTIGMKNLMGVVWDRGWWHTHNLHQCVADFATFRIPDLTVVDAYRVLRANGPMGVSNADTVLVKAQILATDPVAADTAATKLFGMDPAQIPYLEMARELGVGTTDLSRLNIARIRV